MPVNKKTKSSPESNILNQNTVETPVVSEAVSVAAPVENSVSVQKAGAKNTKKKIIKNETVEIVEPVETTPITMSKVTKATKATKGAAKVAKTAKTAKTAKAVKAVKGSVVETNVVPPVKKGGKAKKTDAIEATQTEQGTEAVEGDEAVLDDKSRSFKVQLPNEEEFTGRFTGLTPYQAANKALSKYFRCSDNTNISENHILFSIKESTRGSKRSTYTYKGTRIKLESPITYTIKSANGEDRVITKQYKNQLIKVKKGVVSNNEQPVAIA
jgi:hypothetical protein